MLPGFDRAADFLRALVCDQCALRLRLERAHVVGLMVEIDHEYDKVLELRLGGELFEDRFLRPAGRAPGAKMSTRMGFPSFCAALKSAWVNGFQSAAMAGSEPSMTPARMPAARRTRCAIICCEPPVWLGSHIAACGSLSLITMA